MPVAIRVQMAQESGASMFAKVLGAIGILPSEQQGKTVASFDSRGSHSSCRLNGTNGTVISSASQSEWFQNPHTPDPAAPAFESPF